MQQCEGNSVQNRERRGRDTHAVNQVENGVLDVKYFFQTFSVDLVKKKHKITEKTVNLQENREKHVILQEINYTIFYNRKSYFFYRFFLHCTSKLHCTVINVLLKTLPPVNYKIATLCFKKSVKSFWHNQEM